MPNPSEIQRFDEHGPVKCGVVFDQAPCIGTDGTDLERCRVEQPAQIGPGRPCEFCGGEYGMHEGGCPNRRVDRRTGLPEHPAERAAREYAAAAVVSDPVVRELRQLVADKQQLVIIQAQQIAELKTEIGERDALIAAYERDDAALPAKLLACPCLHTTPCHEDCTCVNPHMSRGCECCCSYGSPEQQRARAELLGNRAMREIGQMRRFPPETEK